MMSAYEQTGQFYNVLFNLMQTLSTAWKTIAEERDFAATADQLREARDLVCQVLEVSKDLPAKEETGISQESLRMVIFDAFELVNQAATTVATLVERGDDAAAEDWIKSHGIRTLRAVKATLDGLLLSDTLRFAGRRLHKKLN